MDSRQGCPNCGEGGSIWCEIVTVDRKTKDSAGIGILIAGIVLSVVGLGLVVLTIVVILEGSSDLVFENIMLPGLGVLFFLPFGVRFIAQFLRADRVKLRKYTCDSCNNKWQVLEGEQNVENPKDSGQLPPPVADQKASAEVSDESAGLEGKIMSVTCHWCNREISGTCLEFDVYIKKPFARRHIIGFVCPSCDTASHPGCRESGIVFSLVSGYGKSVCGECGAELAKPLIMLETDRARDAGVLLRRAPQEEVLTR